MKERIAFSGDRGIDPDHIYDHVGSQLRSYRIGRGLTQAQTAQIIGVSPQQYQKYEDGSSKCSLTYLMELTAFFGIALADVLPKESRISPVLNEADLLARLVAAYSSFDTVDDKRWIVELVESILAMKQGGT